MNPALIALAASALAGAAIALSPTLESPLARPGPAQSPRRAAAVAIATPPTPGEAVPAAVAAVRFVSPGAAPEAATAAAAPAAPSPPTLVGLALGGRQSVAYVMAAGKPWRAGVGERVASWRVASIGKRDVTLRRDGETLTLRLYGPREAPPPPPATPFAAASAAPPPQTPSPTPTSHAAPPAPAPPVMRAAPPPPAGGVRYWVGPPGSAPPGYTPMPASGLPPPPAGRR